VVASLVMASLLAGSPISPPGAPTADPDVFVLHDYRWVPVIVKRPPTTIECSFEVVNGTAGVHAELVSEKDFILFSRGRDYETLANSQTGRAGEFRHIVQTPGRYRVLIMNNRGAPPAAVSLTVRTQVDPPPATLSTGVSALRKRTVILGSLAVFFGTVWWSGGKLLRAWRNRGQIFK
jgi:hypothetical protein